MDRDASRQTPSKTNETATDPPHVAIIILNYNGRELLEKYIPSVIELSYENYQVVVVDNDSSDGSVDFLRSRFPEITVVENDENVGFSRGNNIGAAVATEADYLWFLNTDTKVESTSLSILVEYIESQPKTAIVGPRINYMDDPERIQSVGYDLSPGGVPSARDHGQSSPTNPDPHCVTYVSGSALLIDRDVWDEIGGFDDQNFINGDDTYLCLRAWMRDYRVEVVPQSLVYHELAGSRDAIPSTVAYHTSRSLTRCYLKLLQPRSLLRGFPGFVWLAMKYIVADVIVRNSPKAVPYRIAGYLSPILELPKLYAERRDIQRERVVDDERFLSAS